MSEAEKILKAEVDELRDLLRLAYHAPIPANDGKDYTLLNMTDEDLRKRIEVAAFGHVVSYRSES